MKGHCLCGRVTVEVARQPGHVTFCNCDFCRKLGAAWCYFPPEDVTVSGETRPYSREDLVEVWLAGHHCPNCGTTTHYTFVEGRDAPKVAVNSRMFAQSDLDGVEARYYDAREVETEDDESSRTGSGHIGDGRAF